MSVFFINEIFNIILELLNYLSNINTPISAKIFL